MRKPSLPKLSRSFLDELRGRMGTYIEAPRARLLGAAETILQMLEHFLGDSLKTSCESRAILRGGLYRFPRNPGALP
jgi:hypothetical protein